MFNYKFPDIGEGITEGTLTKWLVKEGDTVKEGQDIAEIETDKMTTSLPSAVSGVVHKLHVKEYGLLEVGKVFITIDDGSSADTSEEVLEEDAPAANVVKVTPEDEASEAAADSDENEPVEEAAGVVGELVLGKDVLPPSQEGQVSQPKKDAPKKVLATPVARKLAKDLGVDIQQIKGSGPGGRVMKEDIQQFAEQAKPAEQAAVAEPKAKPAAQPLVAGENEVREPLTRIRQTISQRMSESKDNLVHTTMLEEVDVSQLVAFRQKMKSVVGQDVKLTYLPFIIKAIVLALKEFPIFNSSYDAASNELVYKQNYNIGIATDTERGLVVPVLFDADRKSIVELAREIEHLAQLARENKFTLEHLRGGTFSITNYGAIGGSFGTPIINYPEAAILGIGRIQAKPVVKDDEIVIGQMLPLSLSIDHRMIDGAAGVRFVKFIEQALSDPELLLLRS